MNVADLAAPGRTPACWEKPALFAAAALDYDPRDPAYRHLDLLGHTVLAAHKAAAEEAAVDACFGCPIMLACEARDDEAHANPRAIFVAGVIAGRTEHERRLRHGRTTTRTTTAPAAENPQIAPGDRGPRNQVDDELVARLTNAGKTSEQIAHELGCSPRTVSRARRRMGIRPAHQAPAATRPLPRATPVAEPVARVPQQAPDTFSAHAVAEIAETVTRIEQAAATPAPASTGRTRTPAPVANPFLGGRPISPAMEAVYNHLAQVGGSDTLDHLLEVAIPHVDPTEAIEWWVRHNSITVDGHKVLRPSKTATPTAVRINEGARAKVFNAISATHRKGRYLDRDGATYTFKAAALAAWTERMRALTTTG